MKPMTIEDQQLVDYILKLTPKSEEKALAALIESDSVLQQRLSVWESILFSLNDETPPVNPPKSVWKNIDNQLFSTVGEKQHKGFFARFFMPITVSFCALLMFSFYFLNQPTFSANIMATKNGQMLWKVEGDNEAITFSSVSNVHVKGMYCVAWLDMGNEGVVRIGVIPDEGLDETVSLPLPKGVTIDKGYKIMVAMVLEENEHVQPESSKSVMGSIIVASR